MAVSAAGRYPFLLTEATDERQQADGGLRLALELLRIQLMPPEQLVETCPIPLREPRSLAG
jgi:hypothetical protein